MPSACELDLLEARDRAKMSSVGDLEYIAVPNITQAATGRDQEHQEHQRIAAIQFCFENIIMLVLNLDHSTVRSDFAW